MINLKPPRKLVPIKDRAEADAILAAIEKFDLAGSPWWSDLDELSSRTMLESLDANPDGLFKGEDNSFEAIGSVYVTLNYGDKKDSASMSETFPVQIVGTIKNGGDYVSIDEVHTDTSSFFE